MRAITNVELAVADIPGQTASTERRDEFAQTFDGYATWGGSLARMANGAVERWEKTSELPPTVTELRACLFFEQRRRNHVGEGVEEGQVPYENDIYARLERLVADGVVDDERATVDAWLKANPGSVAAWVSEAADILREARVPALDLREEHLSKAMKEAINRERPGCATTRVLSSEKWPRLGNSGVDIVVDDSPGSMTPALVLELKWCQQGDDKVHEAIWDLFKVALLVDQYEVGGYLVTAAPTSMWPTALCGDLFSSGTHDSGELFTRQFPKGRPVWDWLLEGGKGRYPIEVPKSITVVESGHASVSLDGLSWEIRAVSVTPGPGRLPLENGWPVGGRPDTATQP
jgi:hypothetical protein